MRRLPPSWRLAGAAAALLAALLGTRPALAASSASSAASDSASQSVGSLSTSLQKSSNASSPDDRQAAGDYRIVDMAQAAGEPGALRLTLQALDRPGAAGELQLTLPQATAERARLAAGQIVNARARPWGLEFARGDDGQAFFLALDDAAWRDLRTRAVPL
ncbi:MAG: hypothetical protein KGJ24_07500 [Burkholderiales bacterium]|nr:hypothetical protein [Burkholderiales bacterium]